MKRSRRRTASRTIVSCSGCRKRHVKCDGRQPCQRCWQDDIKCAYTAHSLSVKQWTPRDAGPTPTQTGDPDNVLTNRGVIFVAETQRIESQYEVLEPDGPSFTTDHKTRSSVSPVARNFALMKQLGNRRSAAAPIDPPITDSADAFYFTRYCNLIGPWFDMFDTQRQWTHMVPHLSLSNRLLFRSIVASCAKQHGLVSGGSPVVALDYYNHALKELAVALGSPACTGTAALFASCLLIGYCEMIDAKSVDWHTHLSGAFSLCSSHGFHGRCGGFAQSCFWVYCRMDLLASIARSEHTLLNTSSWLPTDAELGPSIFDQEWEHDSWCNQVVLILAQTHNLLCDVSGSSYSSSKQPALEQRWRTMSASIDIHETSRPVSFRPISHLPAADPDKSFESIVYVSAAAAAATQMLDLARLLLVLAFPDQSSARKVARLTSDAVATHALSLSRKIVGNSIDNRQTIAWANAVQLLACAGLLLVAFNDRMALLKVLEDIKMDTGWSTHGHVEALRNWWESERCHIYDHANDGIKLENPTVRQVGQCLIRIALVWTSNN